MGGTVWQGAWGVKGKSLLALCPCARGSFEQTIGPPAQAPGQDEHYHRKQRLLDLPSAARGQTWVVAGMRLYIPERHGSIVLQERGLCRQQASQLILRGTLLLASKVQRVAAPGSGDEVQMLAYPGNFNLLEAQCRV